MEAYIYHTLSGIKIVLGSVFLNNTITVYTLNRTSTLSLPHHMQDLPTTPQCGIKLGVLYTP